MRLFFILILLVTFFIGIPMLYAQSAPTDTLQLTLKEAENQFLKNNLSLIIQHYNIDNAQAQVTTARLFQNPQLNYNIGAYNPVTKKLFSLSSNNEDITHNSEYALGISQLFLTARKRNKNIELANVGVQQANYQFFDLLRTLKSTLRNDFFSIYFQQQSEKVYNQEIASLEKILAAFKDQYTKGYISEKEVLRIQSQLYSLQVEYNMLLMSINTTSAEFKMLIKAPAKSKFTAVYNYELDGKSVLTAVPYQTLLDSAYLYRTDLKIAKVNMAYNDVNLKVQRALAWPDITLSANFDKYGSYIRSYNSLGIAFALPTFNRNQGAIKQARVAIDQGKEQYQQQQDHVENDIAVNYENALKLEQFCNSLDPKFKKNYTHLIQEVLKNYTIRNISLLDFLNYYEDYRNNTLLLNDALLNRVIALEQLNYVTGTQLFNK